MDISEGSSSGAGELEGLSKTLDSLESSVAEEKKQALVMLAAQIREADPILISTHFKYVDSKHFSLRNLISFHSVSWKKKKKADFEMALQTCIASSIAGSDGRGSGQKRSFAYGSLWNIEEEKPFADAPIIYRAHSHQRHQSVRWH